MHFEYSRQIETQCWQGCGAVAEGRIRALPLFGVKVYVGALQYHPRHRKVLTAKFSYSKTQKAATQIYFTYTLQREYNLHTKFQYRRAGER